MSFLLYKTYMLWYNNIISTLFEGGIMEAFFTGSAEAQGAFSWQHLTFVTSLMLIMTFLAIFFGRKNRNASEKQRNNVLIWSALLIDGLEIFKIVIGCVYSDDILRSLSNALPLYLCSIQLITIPLAAFSGGRTKEAALDFVFIFGLLGAVLGTYGAAQNYACYPVLSFPNIISGLTHSISGFASLYIAISGMISLKLKNAWISYSILGGFCVFAYIANLFLDTNYMFLMRDDGTPYFIFYNMVNGSRIFYPLIVVLTLAIWITLFYGAFHIAEKKSQRSKI